MSRSCAALRELIERIGFVDREVQDFLDYWVLDLSSRQSPSPSIETGTWLLSGVCSGGQLDLDPVISVA